MADHVHTLSKQGNWCNVCSIPMKFKVTTNTPREIELRERAKKLSDELASQFTTLENKYHHKEIDFDNYLQMGEFYMKANTDKIVALVSQHTDAVIDRVIGINEQELSPDGGKRYEARLIRNNLRGKQRQRYEQLKEGK